ncbi:MAG: HIT domain-containing protein [Candidatus Omnitrophota bacterium]|jgi:ATP adenylyltransferase|nr:MAG: HIT domain-containing protein [Candidatus Omnitrophota bacterium]
MTKRELLWAPWRLKYIRHKKGKKCIFCKAVKSSKADYLIFRMKHAAAMLNIYPYNNGHIMVFPLRHVNRLDKLSKSESGQLFEAVNRAIKLLDKVLKPDGYNIGINILGASGAGIPAHIHVHIVPRWKGDTNFMPIIAGTKVISQSLSELHKLLKDENG